MTFVVMVVGIGLIIFGALVLLKCPSNSRSKIIWGGIEISSKGAGLPLIVLGVICVVISGTGISPGYLCKILPGICNGNDNQMNEFGNCFEGIPEDRVKTMEAGAKKIILIGPNQSKDEAIAINFTENREPIGAIKFQYFGKNLFKVEKVVDSKCQEIKMDQDILYSWDTLNIQFGDHTYALTPRYEDSAGTIVADFIRVSP